MCVIHISQLDDMLLSMYRSQGSLEHPRACRGLTMSDGMITHIDCFIWLVDVWGRGVYANYKSRDCGSNCVILARGNHPNFEKKRSENLG